MPPKRAESSRSLKRKASSPGMVDEGVPIDEEADSRQRTVKKLKRTPSVKDMSSQPKNKALPDIVEFPPREARRLRIVAWNVCGLAASHKKGFKKYVEAEDPDILVLSETKLNLQPEDPALDERFPFSYWSISEKKTYWLAILSKIKPLSVDMTLPGHPDPKSVKGRIVTLEFPNCFLIGTYVVNAGVNLKSLAQKKEWNVHFEKYIRDLDKKKAVIWTGDLNVAPTELDLSNAKKNWNKSPGYTETETASYKNILNPPESEGDAGKFVDVWRNLHPTDREYTYFSYRFNCREKGLGWRIDMFVLSERLTERVKMCEIRSEIYGASDHCPLAMEIEGEL